MDRLDLSSPSAAFADLVLPAHERSTGFPMVSPTRPSESYLVQTLLRDPDGTALYGVLGEPMPPDEPLRARRHDGDRPLDRGRRPALIRTRAATARAA
jgi:hypothetical protein